MSGKPGDGRVKYSRLLIAALLTLVISLSIPDVIYAGEKPALVIIAHGAPMPHWNNLVLNLEEEVKNEISRRGTDPFGTVRVAFMEFSEPSVKTVFTDLQNVGVTDVFVVPLFIAPSGHSLFDVPTILGIYRDQEILDELRDEGIETVDAKIRITLSPTLDKSGILKTAMLKRVRELSTDSSSEAVVLLAHGDERFEPVWDALCREIGCYVCAGTGIDYFDYAFVEVGQSFATDGVSAIMEAARKKEKVIVIGLYLATGVEKMASSSSSFAMGGKTEAKELFADKDIRFADGGILPDELVAEWIADIALGWVESLK